MIRGGNATAIVRDLDRAVRFYVETLGMKLALETEQWAVVDAGRGFRIGLHPSKEHSAIGRDEHSVSIGLDVEHFADAAAILENRGVKIHVVKSEGSTLGFFVDPDGNPLYLCEATRAPDVEP